MEEENILHGPPDPISEFRNISLGQLILNQLTAHRRWVAQVNNLKSFLTQMMRTVMFSILLGDGNIFR